MPICKNITVDEFLKLKNSANSVKLIDIRQPDEYRKECIPDAQNIPTEKLLPELFDNNEVVVFHCQSGNRTRQAEALFKQLGVNTVYILEGGLNAWKQARQETHADKKAPLPIMRQVQIIVGFMVLLGVILAVTLSPYFIIISAFFGAGLLFAGITGHCGLANILMRLPCNKVKH